MNFRRDCLSDSEKIFCRNRPASVPPPGIETARKFILDRGLDARIKILESTGTSALAAEALGCSVAEIAKTIAFFQGANNSPILVALSRDERVSAQFFDSNPQGDLFQFKIERE